MALSNLLDNEYEIYFNLAYTIERSINITIIITNFQYAHRPIAVSYFVTRPFAVLSHRVLCCNYQPE